MALALILAVILTLVSGVYAYLKTTTLSIPQPATSTATNYPLELRMELNKTQFSQGELINPIVYLKNIANRTLQIDSTGGLFNFEVIDDNGTIIYDWRRDAIIFTVPVTKILQPGEEFRYNRQMSIVASTGIALRLPKGNYEIVEILVPLKIAYVEPWEFMGTIALKTQPITILIT
jgi:hypothetical protein